MNQRIFYTYCFTLVVLMTAWVFANLGASSGSEVSATWTQLLSAAMLYLSSHFFRMMRLAILTLERREQILPVIGVHALTAFPSILVPFKLGEGLRLAGFLLVYPTRSKAIGLWLSERFFDITTICALVALLYFTSAPIPKALEHVFAFFFVASLLGVLVFFAVAKLFIFLNRYLVLESTSSKGLVLLRMSYHIQVIEKEIVNSFKGRLASIILSSLTIWALELLTILVLLGQYQLSLDQFPSYLTSSLAGIMPGAALGAASGYVLIQCSTLIVLGSVALLFIATGRIISAKQARYNDAR